jgi:hypothetical protein
MGTNSPVIRLYDINTVQCYVCSLPTHQHTGPVTSIKYIINFLFNNYFIINKIIFIDNVLVMNQAPGTLCLPVEMDLLNYGMLCPINVLTHLKKHMMVVKCVL